MATVFTNGCFDTCHAGHLQLLLFCKSIANGDPVYVGIDSDKKIAKDKGLHRPYFSQEERSSVLLSLTLDGKLDSRGLGNYLIDWVDVFDTDKDLHELIKKREPDVIVKGPDYREAKVIGSDLAKVIFVPEYSRELCSTSVFEGRILDMHRLLGNDS